MKYSLFFLLILVIIWVPSFKPKDQWTPLLDKKLSNWEIYLSFRHARDYKGDAPKDESGSLIKPIGYNTNEKNVFSVIEEKGEPVLRISGEIYGSVFTKQEYENYHLKLKVKWGDKKYEPRTEKLRDSGILYHSVGESGVDYWRAWKLSQEFQIMEGHIGDYWNIANSAIDIRAFLSEGDMNSVASTTQSFLPFGTGVPGRGFCLRSENYEKPNNEWNTLELICFQDKSLHIVNGHVVMVLQHSRYMENGKAVPLTKGKIQLQSEAAEVLFKDIQIRKIQAIPTEYATLFQ
ncbi:3-keto-disaccharide hydrolase [Xanthocytophaga flava]|uniref:3-keto-disaccharide hydrolase n=1 Tax=Xanthocytophaga flava TaxID=3048013 RepID=UPI0028D769E4|nr:DUF1080 domain-containing protein [Xanthocytophaga flavus]MDJ1470637.1 DUF1080 domain-containing protein [Xanthocytophaga flavus]